MLSQNCISPTISEELYITDNQVINLFRSKLNTKYSFVNKGNKNMILPLIKELRFEQSEGIPCKNFISYNLYSDNGRPLQISSNSNPTCVYLWGYGSKYPIAKIENATYAEIESKLGLYQLIDIENSPTFSETQQNLINSLRSSLPKAMVTTYLYEPLVGLITIIDPSGRSKTFEYDKGNRLQGIYDEDKNILEAFEYHYKK
ncbi:hypothetical protein SDC9_165124 [bioreactor metagenome]|uniref:Uncharacterized protein n=1 Tax=bioreactor metagenome TaxID=1076179 RepID=A0A645FW31_9ZZZZ